jgi:hypothetical protein
MLLRYWMGDQPGTSRLGTALLRTWFRPNLGGSSPQSLSVARKRREGD